jgi:hypothetical protein
VVDGADLHLEMEVVADLPPDGMDDLEQESGPVLERASIVVPAVVDPRA